jgi:hypothetical protein
MDSLRTIRVSLRQSAAVILNPSKPVFAADKCGFDFWQLSFTPANMQALTFPIGNVHAGRSDNSAKLFSSNSWRGETQSRRRGQSASP